MARRAQARKVTRGRGRYIAALMVWQHGVAPPPPPRCMGAGACEGV
jgi:hypothetical protein